MPSYVFPGHPGFLQSASAELGHPELAGIAGRIVPLTSLANLCAQAVHGDRAHARDILARASELRDQLAVALRAAELMLADVEAGLARPAPEARAEVPSPPIPNPTPDPRRVRKGASTPRESS